MGTINIRRDIDDPFYRYKMERLQSKIEGKGNGIKSVIVNLSSVAQSLSRSPQYVVKFFGFELGAQVTANPSDDRYIINGAHEASKLQDYLDTFIVKFVLCEACKNPETDLKITKDGQIIRDCKACGQRTNVDLRHKLSGYILKNPPGKENGGDKKGGKKTKSKSKKHTEAEENGNGSGGNSEDDKNAAAPEAEVDGDASDDELTRRIQQEAKDLPKASPKGAKDDGWAIDMSQEAIEQRAQSLADTLSRVVVTGGGEDEEDEEGESGDNPYEKLGSWIEEQKKTAGGVDVEIYKKAVELGIEKKHKTLQVLAQTLFDTNIVKQIPTRAALLQKLITSERHQRAFLGGTERFIGKDHPELIKSVPNILMAFYDNDIITEEVVQKWGSKASKKYVDIATSKKVRKAAEPFLTWLAQAESDDGEDEE
ncbi:domain found in IF2B/IF5-domain-containing protein [Kalaharituber pfeilii]|nr:domain found in IF2B/IF5-domain-containing protein [Kalaharituber pfeilii]